MKKFRCAKFLWQRLLSSTLAIALIVTSWPPAASWAQPSSPVLQTTISAPAPFDLTHLDVHSLLVPDTLGSVQEAWQPSDGTPRGLVIHLQDLHAHPEAQHHLAELIGYLHDTLGVKLLALEGADGPCDTSFFSAFPDPAIVKRVTREFVEEGLFTGAEEYAITHPGQIDLWGVEDATAYLEHLATYQQGVSQQTQPQQALTLLRQTLRSLIGRSYPQPLRQLLSLREAAYAEQPAQGAFTAYVEALVRLGRQRHFSMVSYPAVRAYVRVTQLTRMLDLRRVQEDRDRLLQRLWPRLTHVEQTTLRQLATTARTASRPTGRYERQLVQLAGAHGLWQPQSASKDYRLLRQYLTYLSLLDQSRSPALTRELDTLHHASVWQQVLQATEGQPPITHAQLEQLIASLRTPERFYDLALARNDALVRNTVQKMFHGDAIASSLERFSFRHPHHRRLPHPRHHPGTQSAQPGLRRHRPEGARFLFRGEIPETPPRPGS